VKVMKPVRFKVHEVKQGPQGWVVIAQQMQPMLTSSGGYARLAGCRVQELPAPAELAANADPQRPLRVFLLKDQADHERFTPGQKLLFDP
jgi:hypothetical protein